MLEKNKYSLASFETGIEKKGMMNKRIEVSSYAPTGRNRTRIFAKYPNSGEIKIDEIKQEIEKKEVYPPLTEKATIGEWIQEQEKK